MTTFEEVIAQEGKLIYTNVGDSMLPLIRQDKDLLIIEKTSGRLKKYDVPLYRRDSGQYVLHRMLKVRQHDYILCGDHRYHRDSGISDRHIDLVWGIWTLAYNLKTTRWSDRFLDAYGREVIEPEMLRCVAAMEMIGDT